MTYATWSDVERRFERDLTDREKIQVTEWLGDLEAEILERIPDLAAFIADGKLQQRTVVKIQAAAVLRVLRNPDGKLTERIDDYSWTRSANTSTGELRLLDSEWEQLTPQSATDAFTIRPHYEPGWCDITPDYGWYRS